MYQWKYKFNWINDISINHGISLIFILLLHSSYVTFIEKSNKKPHLIDKSCSYFKWDSVNQLLVYIESTNTTKKKVSDGLIPMDKIPSEILDFQTDFFEGLNSVIKFWILTDFTFHYP